MKKDQNRRDRWLELWLQNDLLPYAHKVGIQEAATIIPENWFHIGGVCRYCFKRNAAFDAVMAAFDDLQAPELFHVVSTKLMGKYTQQRVVDKLIHQHPPESKVGVHGKTYTFASEFVLSKVAMVLALETTIETEKLLNSLKGVAAGGSMWGVLFEAYAARKLCDGGTFTVKEIGSGTEATLNLKPTSILQKDTKTLNKINYPPGEIKDKVVWPHLSYDMQAMDMFMLLQKDFITFQMTVACSHKLDLNGTKAFLRYFDSVCRALFPGQVVLKDYSLYFAVPADIYKSFSNSAQPFTDKNGTKLNTTEVGKRVKQ
jgi:hypothetical protein